MQRQPLAARQVCRDAFHAGSRAPPGRALARGDACEQMIRKHPLYRCSSVFIGVLAFSSASTANAADRLVNIDTRPGVRVGYWWMERPDAAAQVVLLPGGKGGGGGEGGGP